MFQGRSVSDYNQFEATCPTGFNLLFCGLESMLDKVRSAKPKNNRTCECNDNIYSTYHCYAWCTNLPVKGFEIVKSVATGTFSATCPAGKNAIGCHIVPSTTAVQAKRQFFPVADGTGCSCYDSNATECVATCANQIQDYEVVSVWGKGFVYANCTDPTNRVLGCGIDPSLSTGIEKSRSCRPINANSCRCFDTYGTQCYAICGKIW